MALVFLSPEQQFHVETPMGVGRVICTDSFIHDNYIWTVVLQRTGEILHYSTKQITYCINHTLEVNLERNKPIFPTDHIL